MGHQGISAIESNVANLVVIIHYQLTVVKWFLNYDSQYCEITIWANQTLFKVRDGTLVALKFFRPGATYEGAVQRERYILDTFLKVSIVTTVTEK